MFHAWGDYNGATDQLEVHLFLTDIRPVNALLSYTVDLVPILGTTDAPIGNPRNPGGAVPEPGSVALVALGLAGASMLRRRKG
ncbi:MAG: PEP-CTERM sorting domain-containing protein [Proteobacteria bacterium]|nr:PEP-CTERM sorting domain-containing protein [Pseudomonadota bacterium]